jgi:hydroxymethyl cephem carbamoyltransferase
MKPGHDGAIAVIEDRKLLFSLEGEKDSFPRHADLTPMSIVAALERIDAVPDVIAMGGWYKTFELQRNLVEVGYGGGTNMSERVSRLCGKEVRMFSSSHTRSHIMMGAGMAPPDDAPRRAVLVWEGREGDFYLLDERWRVIEEIPVLQFPGGRYAYLFTLAEPGHADWSYIPSLDDSGKLMALAAYGDPDNVDDDVRELVELFVSPEWTPDPKGRYKDSGLYNIGVEAQATKDAAALLTQRLFDVYADVALTRLPRDIPLYISGGCGLNCDWNVRWRDLGHFSSVFVPPCTNDSGSALGTALDGLAAATGDPRVEWDVYCGLEFEWDFLPRPHLWKQQPLELGRLAGVLDDGHVVAWVQGRWEMGPRALGNRSLLAEPSSPRTRDLLNEIKKREGYRPIAPCVRLEDAGRLFDADFHDPYMLYFRTVQSPELRAVTHVDGSARAQTVTPESNGRLHDLLSAFAERRGIGVLCNTSLNYQGLGFINHSSDLALYCETRGIDHFVVNDQWFEHVGDR